MYKCGITQWKATYDRQLPPKILQLCLPEQCKVCTKSFNAYHQAKDHYLSRIHGKNINLYLTDLASRTTNAIIPKQIVRSNKRELKEGESECTICNKSFNSFEVRNSHMSGKTHLKNLSRIQSRTSEPFPSLRLSSFLKQMSKGKSMCKICNIEFSSSKSVEEHIAGKRHRLKLMKPKNKAEQKT